MNKWWIRYNEFLKRWKNGNGKQHFMGLYSKTFVLFKCVSNVFLHHPHARMDGTHGFSPANHGFSRGNTKHCQHSGFQQCIVRFMTLLPPIPCLSFHEKISLHALLDSLLFVTCITWFSVIFLVCYSNHVNPW